MDARLRQIADYLLSHQRAHTIVPSTIGSKLLPHFFVLDVERAASGLAQNLRIRLTGTALDQIFGRPLVGRALEEFIHGPRGDKVIGGFHLCANKRTPTWMRQVVNLPNRVPRFVEGVAVFVEPERIYGGLIAGDVAGVFMAAGFVSAVIVPSRKGETSALAD